MAVRLHTQQGAAERASRVTGEQRLAAQRRGHHPGRDRLGQPVHVESLGAGGHVVGAALAHPERADVDAGPRDERQTERGDGAVVGECETRGVGGGIEHSKQAVGLFDLAATPCAQQVARGAIVGDPVRGHGGVAQGFGDAGAVDHVGQQKGADFAHRGRKGCGARRVGGPSSHIHLKTYR